MTPPIRYLDFDLQIQSAASGFRSQVLNSPAGEASGALGPIFTDLELENYLLKLGRPRRATLRRINSPEGAAAKALGGRLFGAVFSEEVLDCLRRSVDLATQQGAGLRIRLRLKDAPELANYPWEYLYDRSQNWFVALSSETPVVRYLDLPTAILPLKVELPLRILAMISGSTGCPQLDSEREWDLLSKALAGLQGSGQVVLERLEDATLETLVRRLQRGECHILHFVGHGAFDPRIDDGVLVLEDRNKRERWTSGEDLGVHLRDHRTLRLAVLNACEGARGSAQDPFSGVAQSLVQQGIPAVIAMQFEITDEAAIAFASGFYATLADGCPVDTALAQARKAIHAAGHGVEWGTPVLYLRSRDGVVFEPEERKPLVARRNETQALEGKDAGPRAPPRTQDDPKEDHGTNETPTVQNEATGACPAAHHVDGLPGLTKVGQTQSDKGAVNLKLSSGDQRSIAQERQGVLSQPPPAEPASGDNILVKDEPAPPKKAVADGSSQKMGGQIFISYRRDDSSMSAGRLYDRLRSHFASNQIFMDVDLDAGIDFVEAIGESVGSCDVLIAVIGGRWLISSDEERQRPLDNPEDFVRIEIATALKRGIRVIPVLVEGASVPRSCDLPDDLKSLVRRNALEVSHGRFRADSERLIVAVERALEKTTVERREREEKERLEAERRERQEKERLEDTKVNLRSKGVPRRALKQRRGEVPHQHRLGRMSGLKEALRAETRGPLLEPWDFTPLLVEKLKGFTGREWVFQVIDKWRLKCSPPALLIVGEPGVGKSTVLAQLIQRNPGGYILAYHCCRTDTPATLDPAGFVRNLAAMFSARFDEYAAMLEGPAIVDALARADTDPASAFDAAILSPLHKIRVPEGGRRYLVIDALDESLVRMRRPRIFDVLSTRFDRLPLWLGVVASMRDDPGLLSQLGSMSIYVLDAKDQRNQEDIRRFIKSRLAEPVLHDQAKTAGRITACVENDLLKSSAGNFLFVTTALNAVESGQLGFDQIEKLPAGLRSLYELFFHRLFPDSDVDFGPFRQVLETVAAAREPLTREQIAAATGLEAEEELPRSLSRLASFLPVCDGRYTFFHKSLFDWLTGWETRDDRPFAGPYYISLKKGRKRLTDRCWAEYERGLSVASLYALRHLPGHLHGVGRDNDARSVLLNFDFLQAKLQATGANKLIADYEFLPEDTDLRLVQSAIRLSAHVLARDHRQLAGQLTGRLLGDRAPNIQALLQEALQKTPWPWLRPLKPTLAPPGGPLIRTFQGHTDWVHAVVLTPDGRCAISGSRDHTLQVWDLEAGQSVRTLEGHTDVVNAAAVTPNGNYAISGSADRTLRVWDLQGGGLVRTLRGHTDRVNAVAVTPDGSRAISASADRTLRVWDLESGQLVRTLEGHLDVVNALAVTPDGHAAISASSDHTLRVWDLESGQLVRTLEGHPDWVHAVVVTPDGRRAISGSADNMLRMWDLESGRSLRTLEGHINRVTAVVLVPDGRRAISASADHTLRMWDLERGQLLRTLEGHTDWVTAVVVTPDGQRALSASADHTLRMWDLEGGVESVHKLAGHTDNVTAVALMPDGRRAALVSDYQVLRVWDLESGELLRTLEGHTDWVTAVAVTPDGRCAVSASADHTLRMWDLESGRSVRTLADHTDLVSAVAVTLDGRRAISASADHTLRIWDLESGQSVHTLAGLVNLTSAITMTPDGRCALWGSDVGALLVWNLDIGKTVRALEGHTHWVTAVAITPDGRRAVSASSGGTLRLWDLENGQLVCTLQDRAAPVNAVTVTPDGRRAISASSDHTLRVWDVETGTFVTAFTGESPMSRCAIAPDGRTIIAREKSGRGHFLRLEGLD